MDVNPKVTLLDGCDMPLLGLGTMNWRPNDKTFNLNDFLLKAVETGYLHFDLAKFFENEQQIGDAFRAIFDLKKPVMDDDGQPVETGEMEPTYLREDFFFSLKMYNVRGKSMVEELKASLASNYSLDVDLKMSYVDLLLLDFTCSPTSSPPPPAEGEDPPVSKPAEQLNHLPLHEVWKQMEECKELGLCKSLGVSNFSQQALLNLVPFVKHPPCVNQV